MHRLRTMFGSMALAIALTALVTATLAQGPGPGGGRGFGGFGGPGGRGGSVFSLLDNAAVQEELKVTDAQKAQIKTTNEAVNTKRQAFFSGFRRGNDNGANGGGAQRPDPETMRADMQELQNQTEAAFARILSKPQRSQLNQIDLQRQGPMAVLRPEIAEKLGIDDGQMEEM